LVALPGQLVFETSSGCGPVKAAAAIGLPRSWYSISVAGLAMIESENP
jgi:hypothetical protein